MSSTHRIETMSWEAVFSQARLAHAEQDRLSQFIHHHARRCLSQRFDALSPGNEVWALDRLEIDIGHLSLKDSPSQWLRQFDAAVQRSLARLSAPRSSNFHSSAMSTLAQPAASASSGIRQHAATHDMGQFLHYLQYGVLPWGLPLRSARNLAGWLERLARQHGQGLWQGLQQLMPPEPVLARLAQIAPHAGLQALLGVRHRDLAEGMLLLDDAWLLPLQMRGRLSAYQVQRLQQQLRVAGLHALWGLSGGALGGSRQRRLLQALRSAHADLLGPAWNSLRQALRGQALPRQPGSELAAAMLNALLADDASGTDEPSLSAAKAGQTSGLESELSVKDAALLRLQAQVQAWADGRQPAVQAAQISAWFSQLHDYAPAALAQSLRAQLRRRSGRRAWSLALPAHQQWQLLSLLVEPAKAQRHASAPGPNAKGSTAGYPRPAPPQWADSLRQTALQLVQQCPAGARPGLSEMQALLVEASLAYLLEHGRLPATHSAWLAVWRAAGQVQAQAACSMPAYATPTPAQRNGVEPDSPDLLALTWLPALIGRWQPPYETEVALESDSASATRPPWPAAALRRWLWEQAELCSTQQAAPPSPAVLQAHWQQAWRTLQRSAQEASDAPQLAPSHAAADRDSGASPQILQQLQALWLQCEHAAWGPAQRLALARLLEPAQTCALWCAHFDEAQRWRWLQAQFGPVSLDLQRCAAALLPQLVRSEQAAQSDGAPAAPSAATLARHWALLCEHLFVLAGPADPTALRRHYLAAIQPHRSRPLTPALQPSLAPSLARYPSPPPAVPAVVTPPSTASAPIWVEDAGQVLLCAYAERLFKHLGLVEAGHFVHAQAQARGVLCLQGLVRGEEPSSEPFWPLSKLLCGVEPGAVLPDCEPLSAQEQALLGQLLGAVIAHWTAIGNTSVAGLRESFLQREGRLEQQHAKHGEPLSWRLKVQGRAFDMLLDRLPWGFSIIKLPWMQGVLHVDWR